MTVVRTMAMTMAVGLTAGLLAVPFGGRAEPPQAQRALGFDVGEERRYVLGPPEALEPGEGAVWIIRLDRVSDDGVAVFAFEHLRTGPERRANTPAWGEELAAQMSGDVTVNPHGFPLLLAFDVKQELYGYPEINYHARYEFDGRDWVKFVSTRDRQWDIAVPLTGHDNLDRSVPAGLYLFLPDSFHCAGYRGSRAIIERLRTPRPTAGTGTSPTTSPPRVEREALPCEVDTDLGFLNPGFLSLAWPAVVEADARHEVLFFTPTGADLFSGPTIGGSLFGISTPAGPGGGDMSTARDVRRLYVHSHVELDERVTIRLRGRRLDTIAARIGRLPGTVFFDDGGKVLLVDIDPWRFLETGIARAVLGGAADFNPEEWERRHVRLLFPSEY